MKLHTCVRLWALCCLLVSMITFAANSAQASIVAVTGSDLTGSRTTPAGGGLTGGGIWQTSPFVTVNWDISFNNLTMLWDYEYDVIRPTSSPNAAVSHWILELTHFLADGTDLTNYWTTLFSSINGTEVGTFGSQGGSNPGIPGDIFGVKVNGAAPLDFSTSHAPVWGDFYAKDGNAGGSPNYAYNEGFFADTGSGVTSNQGGPPDANGPFTNWVPRPDGVSTPPDPDPQGVVPEATSMLIWLGLATVCGYGAKKRLQAA